MPPLFKFLIWISQCKCTFYLFLVFSADSHTLWRFLNLYTCSPRLQSCANALCMQLIIAVICSLKKSSSFCLFFPIQHRVAVGWSPSHLLQGGTFARLPVHATATTQSQTTFHDCNHSYNQVTLTGRTCSPHTERLHQASGFKLRTFLRQS